MSVFFTTLSSDTASRTIVGYRKDGRPIFPIRGGSEPPNQQTGTDSNASGGNVGSSSDNSNSGGTGPEMVTDEHGAALYPKNTAVAEMTPVQQAHYWRTESKKQQRKAEDAERKLTEKKDPPKETSQNGDPSGTVPTQDAVAAARAEGQREGQRAAALVALTTSLQMRGKKPDEISELLDPLNPDKFLDDNGTLDGTKVANYLARVAPASGGSGGGAGNPGQGNQESTGATRIAAARAEAEKRYGTKGDANRGALGGLRR